jgi:CRP-like cAMP-binding protein
VHQRLKEHLKHVDLDVGQVLYDARSAIEYAYFPTAGTLSAVVVMPDGDMIEVATIGNEGGVGLPTSASGTSSPNKVFVQVPGAGVRIEAAALEKESRQEPLRQLLADYHTAFLYQVSQSVACNGLHPVLQRCCRWLLMTHDRVSGNEIQLTHEFLATMLGVRRASVSDTLQALHNQGLIENGRGVISVVNRKGMEDASCVCYQLVRDEYARLLK